jgi:hypothetical protein
MFQFKNYLMRIILINLKMFLNYHIKIITIKIIVIKAQMKEIILFIFLEKYHQIKKHYRL